jgi:hypothetical protein
MSAFAPLQNNFSLSLYNNSSPSVSPANNAFYSGGQSPFFGPVSNGSNFSSASSSFSSSPNYNGQQPQPQQNFNNNNQFSLRNSGNFVQQPPPPQQQPEKSLFTPQNHFLNIQRPCW